MEPKNKDSQINRRNLSWLQEQSVGIKISLLQNHIHFQLFSLKQQHFSHKHSVPGPDPDKVQSLGLVFE